MSSSYDIWLTDDAGRRLALLSGQGAFFSYSRTTSGLPVCQFGMPYQKYRKLAPSLFQVDWRLDFWRSPWKGYSKRRESSYFLRKFRIYRREDGIEIIEFYGRGPLDILRRFSFSSAETTDYADDIMKTLSGASAAGTQTTSGSVPPYQIIDSFYYTTGEYTKDGDSSLGPSISISYSAGNSLDAISDIKGITFEMNSADPTNRRIFFDVVEGPGLPGGFGYIFKTYADLRGQDRTSGLVFSVENGNIKEPVYYEDYLDQITDATALNSIPGANGFATSTEVNLSRWNRCKKTETVSVATADEANSRAYKMLNDYKSIKSINCTFLNTPGGPVQPRSLYGVDWDLGDLLPVRFADKKINAEVQIVYVAVNEDGEETVTGRNTVGAQ